ncbi:TonB family protein [Hymenobacter sediminicola]|uniref:TonB family protein n=1 Tax=Hymenobacter sediminicola TaxID=2761579 RepID=A0A7G7W6P3_9BACT|nr:TonB family protein [Hymenobacter sediminicola]QNH62036.1 TonB family protein [Hymenobacter sediminicola]
MPVYPGGPTQLLRDLTASVVYPEVAVGTNVGGNVLVDFIVAPNGRIYEVKLNKGIVSGPGQEAAAQALNEAAVAAVQRLKKKWQAGRQNGKAVAVSFTVPLAFAPSGR